MDRACPGAITWRRPLCLPTCKVQEPHDQLEPPWLSVEFRWITCNSLTPQPLFPHYPSTRAITE